MSVSLASTFTQSVTAENHGKPPSVSWEAMDVDRDTGRSPTQPDLDRSLKHTRKMDASDKDDSAQPRGAKIARVEGADDVATATQQPLSPKSSLTADTGDQSSQREQLDPLPTNPALTHNILSLYDLNPLVATVARTDPVTGEKINKMRKSYEGQLKTLGLTGRNKAVRHEENKGMGLSEMAAWPEEEWENQKAMGKEVTKGLPETLMGKLGKALQMQPGRVPNNDYWEDLLGIDKAKPNDPNAKTTKPTNMPNGQQPNGIRHANTAAPNASTPQPAEPIRARRTTKKRRYDDGSFEGYGEGYADDDEMGYSSGESRGTRTSGGHRKRRKTKDFTNNSSEFPSRNNSFVAGPVSISAYGR